MRYAVLVLCVAVGLVKAQDDGVKKDLVKFKGTWSVVSSETPGGGKAPAELLKTIKITFSDDKIIAKVGDQAVEGVFKIDAGQKPTTIDVIRKVGDKDEVTKGIYLFEGDILKFCTAETGFERPKEFKADAATKTSIMLLKKDPT